jgi:hypothetical protein
MNVISTKHPSLQLVALASAFTVLGCSASVDPVEEERVAGEARALSGSTGIQPNLLAPAWSPAWDRPMPGAGMSDATAFYDGPEVHFAMTIRDGDILHRYWRNGRWNDDLLGGRYTGAAISGARTGSSYTIAARDYAGHTAIRYFDGQAWTPAWVDIGGVTYRRPAIATAEVTHVFVVGTNNQLYQHYGWTGEALSWSAPWQALEALPGGRSIAGAPAATLRKDSTIIDVVVTAGDETLWHYSYDGHAMHGLGWEPIAVPGRYHGEVTIASHLPGAIEIAALGSDHLLRHISSTGSGFAVSGVIAPCSPANQGSLFLYPQIMAMGSSQSGVLDLFVTSDDLYHNSFARGNRLQPAGYQVCGTCNVDGDACCAATSCHNGLTCSAGRCRNPQCGTLFAPACATGRKCQPGMTVDVNGMCQTCGGLDDRCCAEDSPTCTRGLCTNDASLGIDYCAHGGSDGERACPAPQVACASPTSAPDAHGVCSHCGEIGEQACAAGACRDPRAVLDPFTHHCEACGDIGQRACTGGRCFYDSARVTSDGRCDEVACGLNVGQVCCYMGGAGGYFCQGGSGLVCDGGHRCRAPAPPPPAAPPPDAPNCGAYAAPATECCHNKQACETGLVCTHNSNNNKNYCLKPPPTGSPPLCPAGKTPTFVKICARCNIDYAITGVFCDKADALRLAAANYPGCTLHDGGDTSVCPGLAPVLTVP